MCEEQIFDFNLSQLSILHYILCIVSNYLNVCTGFDKISGEERPVCLCNEGYRGKKQGQQDVCTDVVGVREIPLEDRAFERG